MQRKSELYYEEIGEDFDRFMSDYDVERRAWLIDSLMTDAFGPGLVAGDALEVGCGTGAITRHYRQRVGELLVTDISGPLAQTTGAENDASSQAEDATQLSFDDDRFDLIVSSECVEHCPEPARAVGEMVRVLRPGGTLILTTPNRIWLPVVVGAQRAKLRPFQGNEVFMGFRELESAVAAAGGDLIRHTGCHLAPWQIPGVKPLLRRLDERGDALARFMINQAVLVTKSTPVR